jgi:hypothetical protein
MCVVNTDFGCGIIKYGNQKIYKEARLKRCLRYKFFERNKDKLLNIISVREFERLKL